MSVDLGTFLVALYTIVDDLYRAHVAPHKPRRPGKKPELSDSEVLTLVVCAQWLGCPERALGRHAAAHWRAYFPRLLDQSAFNRRARDLAGALVALIPLVADRLGAALAPYQVFDGVPVPLARRVRGRRRRLFGDEAAIGKGGSDRAWYFGCQLLLACTADGLITGFVLGPADTEGHWLGEALLCWRADPRATPWGPEDPPPSHRRGGRYRGPTGPLWPRAGAGRATRGPGPAVYIADGGFRGAAWAEHWRRDYRACVLPPGRYGAPAAAAARRQHAGWRQVVETVNEHLTHVFGLPAPRARSRWGLLTRIAAKLLAFNLGVWLNRSFGRPTFAFATLVAL
jgi:hypothetical protein